MSSLYSYSNLWFVFLAYTLDGVNLKGYFAYAFSDQRDPGFGMYGHVQEEVILKSSLAHYKNIIHHNGFPATSTSQQQCPHAPVHSSGHYILTKQPVVGFLSLVSSCMLITVCLIIYYAVKRHKIATKKWRKMVPVDSYSFNLFVLMVCLWQPIVYHCFSLSGISQWTLHEPGKPSQLFNFSIIM